VVELPIDDVDVGVEDEGVSVKTRSTVGDLGSSGENCRQRYRENHKSHDYVSFSHFAMGTHPTACQRLDHARRR
jgi:hypothetical protein